MRLASLSFLAMLISASAFAQDVPKVADPRLVVELFAAAPDIVHPISCDFDAKGRLLVIESHTHFAPKDYKGPKFDRIRAFDVSKKEKPTTFFEGTRHTMDLAVHPDGSVYIATRNEILRLRDTKGTGVADEKTRIVFLDTKGDYPHNGLSGLCFDSKGDLTFGMGENLGAKYTISGADGVKFSGEGDGGHIFHCTADGKKLRKVATGFWNPFGICRDIYGRTFCVDNDPDQAPPCRMVHVVEGGDYGFRFMYGRSGKHPFQSWHGTLPGTLPMMTGVGEAPCEIISYESDGLPKEYLGKLMVTSWADHRVELYKVKPHGASFKADREPFVQGGNNFRPVGLCAAPDGSLYVTDWVLPNYNLHGKGAIWRIREKVDTSRERKRPEDLKEAIFSMHRPLREAAAKKLASDDLEFLRDQLDHKDTRVRASALQVLIDHDPKVNAIKIAQNEKDIGIREMAVRALPSKLVGYFADKKFPAILRVEGLRYSPTVEPIIASIKSGDPFLQHAAISGVAKNRDILTRVVGDPANKNDARIREIVFLAICQMPEIQKGDGGAWLRAFLKDPDEMIRFLAVKRIADEKLEKYRLDILRAMLYSKRNSKESVRMYIAYATAIARLDGKDVNEQMLSDYFIERIADIAASSAQQASFLRQVPASHPKLTVDLLAKLLKSEDAALKFEAVRALVDHPNPKRQGLLLDVFRDANLGVSARAFATLGLGADAEKELAVIAKDEKSPFRADALRALNGKRDVEKNRPAAKDLDAWLKRLEGKADADAGARIFFHPKLGGCYKCHRIDGRGQDVGPDLSNIGNTDRRHLLESILQPSNNVAPHYVAWHLETADGKVRQGMLLHTDLDRYTYLDSKGGRFTVRTSDLVEQRPLTMSIMPDGLADTMTDQEMRDLLAYLQARK